jgi:hypothetical protein
MWIFIVLLIVICICVYIGLILALNIFLVERFGIDTLRNYVAMVILILVEITIPVATLSFLA